MLSCPQQCWRYTCSFMLSHLDARSFARRQIWLFRDADHCTSPEGLLAAEFSGSEIRFHLVFKNWHQICKWLLCELLREALSKLQINDFQREMAMYFPCALACLPSAKHQPSALAHPCVGASAQAWLKDWFEVQQILAHVSK